MARRFMDIVLTPSVMRLQDSFYGRHQTVEEGSPADALSSRERSFIEARNSFYMATVNEDGWPYIQHRGGPNGFLKVINDSQLAFADYKGNRQLISSGNLSQNDRVSLFLMDYPARARLKILGKARIYSADDAPRNIIAAIGDSALGRTERIFIIDIISYDWNCPQYITPRYTHEEIAPVIDGLKQRIQELENA